MYDLHADGPSERLAHAEVGTSSRSEYGCADDIEDPALRTASRGSHARWPTRRKSTLLWSGSVPPTVTFYSLDRKSTRLNSSHGYISYAVFCLKKKKMSDTSVRRSVYD